MAGIKRILLVEPEAVVAEVTAFRLELLGYFVETVDSAEAAGDQLGKASFDLIITDLDLPGIKGLAFIERITSDPDTSDLPLIVISLEADLDHVQAAHNAGACDFLVVPFQPETLEEKVETQLANSEKRAKAKKKEAKATSSSK